MFHTKFKVRCRLIVINDDKLLVFKHSEKADFYALPGGHLEVGETPMTCIKREIKEELGIDITEPKLAYVYGWNTEKDGENVEFIYYVKDDLEFLNLENKVKTHAFEIFETKWIAIDSDVKVYPIDMMNDFRLGNIDPSHIKYITC